MQNQWIFSHISEWKVNYFIPNLGCTKLSNISSLIIWTRNYKFLNPLSKEINRAYLRETFLKSTLRTKCLVTSVQTSLTISFIIQVISIRIEFNYNNSMIFGSTHDWNQNLSLSIQVKFVKLIPVSHYLGENQWKLKCRIVSICAAIGE